MLTVAVRLEVDELADSVSVTVPFPLPLAGADVSHHDWLDAAQAQPPGALTLMAAVPATLVFETDEADTVTVHAAAATPKVNGLEASLRAVPAGPTAATRIS
jgi:hypothetical protein